MPRTLFKTRPAVEKPLDRQRLSDDLESSEPTPCADPSIRSSQNVWERLSRFRKRLSHFRKEVARARSRWSRPMRFVLLLLVGCYAMAPYLTTAQEPTLQRSASANAGERIGGSQAETSAPAADGQFQIPDILNPERMLSKEGLTSTLKILMLLTVLSLAPSILIMTTCFIRFVIVLGLLRQALGTQQLPPNQVIISLCLFLTFLVMAPVWKQAYETGIRPYTDPQPGVAEPSLETAFENTTLPIRKFMGNQIEVANNSDAVEMFLEIQRPDSETAAGRNYKKPEFYEDLPLSVLLPAYMMSELKVAFIIGFQIYLPFLIIDMVVASVLISMGMMMLPPVLISLPFKLLLFVLIDGWYLTVEMLLGSVPQFVG